MSSGCGDVLSLADLQTAKKHQIFEAEVITGKSGGVADGADIDYATNQVTGQTQKTLPAVLRDAGFEPASFDFTTGGTLGVNDRDKVVYDPVSMTWYSWSGVLPKVIPAGTNPVGDTNWKPQTDPNLRNDLISGDSSKGDALVAVKQPYTGAILRTQHDKNAECVSISDFGAVGDGVTDDTLAIQAAVDSGYRKITAPAGKYYRITNEILIKSPCILDMNRSEINLDDASGLKNIIKVGDGVTKLNAVFLRNLVLTRQQVSTAGAAVMFDYTGVCGIQDSRIYGNQEIFNGVHVRRGIITGLHNNHIGGCIGKGIYLEGTGTGGDSTIDTTIQGNRIEFCHTGLDTWDFVEGVFCRSNIFYNHTSACVAINASTNANGIGSIKLQENDFDTTPGSGVYLNNVSNIQVTDCWFSSCQGISLFIDSNVTSIVVDGNQIYPTDHGIQFAGSGARINSNLISGGQSAVYIKASATDASISCNSISWSQIAVNIYENPVGVHIVGNSFSNTTSAIFGDTSAPGAVIQNNKGDTPVGTTSYIAPTGSPFTYTAGPRPEFVQIYGGAVSQITIGSSAFGYQSNMGVSLAPRQSVTITYSSAPYMAKNIL